MAETLQKQELSIICLRIARPYLLIDEIDKMFFIHTVDILTGGVSMDMVAGSMILVERDGQGDPSLARGSTERNF